MKKAVQKAAKTSDRRLIVKALDTLMAPLTESLSKIGFKNIKFSFQIGNENKSEQLSFDSSQSWVNYSYSFSSVSLKFSLKKG